LPKINLFSAASDTATEHSVLFSAALPWPPKIMFLKRLPDSFLLVCFSPSRAARSPSGARRPPPRHPPPCPRADPPARAARPPRRSTPAASAACRCRPPLPSTARVYSSHHSAVVAKLFAIQRYFLRILFYIFGGRYLVASEISIYL
jgi:hypothetical protein